MRTAVRVGLLTGPVLGALGSLAAATPAFAQGSGAEQQAPPATGQGSSNPQAAAGQVEQEIVVTAQKREQRAIDVPMSLTVLSQQVIEDAGVEDVQDLSLLTPGLEVSETIGRQTTSPTIRGVAPQGLFSDPTVLTYVDGFTLGFSRTLDNAALFDLERIEVLKGPQATLYGRNALGGVINYVTRKPGNEIEGYVRGEIASYNSYEAAGSLSLPIARDVAAIRVAAGIRGSGGFLDNRFNGDENVNGEQDINARATIRLRPTDRLEFNFTASYSSAEDECGDCSNVPASFTGNTQFATNGVNFNEGNRFVNIDVLGGFDRNEHTFVLNAEYDFGGATLTSVTGYGRVHATVVTDLTRLPGPSFLGTTLTVDTITQAHSEELRLASNGEQRFNWLIGAYAFKSQHDSNQFFDTRQFSDSRAEAWNYAGFVNVDYRIGTQWVVGGGLRYDYERRRAINFFAPPGRTRDASEWLPRLTLSYYPNDDMHLYATISKGYHSGGFNATNAPNLEVEAEFLWNYEVGIKGRSPSARLQYEVAGYYISWTDMQVTQTFAGPPGGIGGTFLVNAGKARILGLEALLQASLTSRLSATATLTYNDAEFVEFIDPLNAPAFGLSSDLSGRNLPFIPKFSGTLSAQYLAPIFGDWSLRLRSDLRYTGPRSFEPTNLTQQNAYWLANLYAGIQNDSFEIGLFVTNLFDERYSVGGSISTSFFPPLFTIGDPRIAGVRARASF